MRERPIPTPADVIASVEALWRDPEVQREAISKALLHAEGQRALFACLENPGASACEYLAYANRTSQLLCNLARREGYSIEL